MTRYIELESYGLGMERRSRTVIEVVVPYYAKKLCTSVRCIAEGKYRVVLLEFFSIQVPTGCQVPSCPVPLLASSSLVVDPEAFMWVLFASHFVESADSGMLWEM